MIIFKSTHILGGFENKAYLYLDRAYALRCVHTSIVGHRPTSADIVARVEAIGSFRFATTDDSTTAKCTLKHVRMRHHGNPSVLLFLGRLSSVFHVVRRTGQSTTSVTSEACQNTKWTPEETVLHRPQLLFWMTLSRYVCISIQDYDIK